MRASDRNTSVRRNLQVSTVYASCFDGRDKDVSAASLSCISWIDDEAVRQVRDLLQALESTRRS